MTINNNDIIKKSAITTSSVTSGLLSPEQSKQFLIEAMDKTVLGRIIRTEFRRAKKGEIDKIGISNRQLRKKTENFDDGHRGQVKFDKVEYSTVDVRLPWEISEETLRQNIEGEGLEATITKLMTEQVAIDLEDLWLNADSQTPETDEDYEFLYLNDGFIKQIREGGHIVDCSLETEMTFQIWNKALLQMPNKYNNGNLRWLMSPHRKQMWETTILEKSMSGGNITDKRIENPYSITAIEIPFMPDDVILLVDPRNLINVCTYDVNIRKTTEGKEAIMTDTRFYAIHLDFDSVIEELDATVIIDNLPNIN